VAWYDNNSDAKTHEVGMKRPNGLGISDMSGNVSEWCWDRWDPDYYTSAAAAGPDPTGGASANLRVVRGGPWNGYGQSLRLAFRGAGMPLSRYSYYGFRLVRPAQ
jgi:formylglycine-generating enzyme required for sulfatase activity